MQALFKGNPPLEVYPAKDRTEVLERQNKLGEVLKELEMFRQNNLPLATCLPLVLLVLQPIEELVCNHNIHILNKSLVVG